MSDAFAIVKIAGGQNIVRKGQVLEVEKITGKKGALLKFDEVLLFSEKGKVKIGNPYIKGKKVEAKIVEQFLGKKVRIITYKAKSRRRRKKGHRQEYTKIEITKI